MSENVDFKITLNMSEAETEMARVQKQADAVTQDWAKKHTTMKREIQTVTMTIRSTISVFRSVLSVMGLSLTPVQQAIVGSIETLMVTIFAMHRALDTATMGISAALTATLSIIAFGISLAAIDQANRGMTDAQAQMQRSVALMDSLAALTHTSGRW